jgi:hypothetical protein
VETALEEKEEALGEQRNMTVDQQLRDFSRRRASLSESEWHAFYLLVKRVLAHECADLIARLIDPRDDLIHGFFMDKVFILTGEQNEIYHAGALKTYFLRYLLDELRPLRRRANDSGLQDADGGELSLLELALNAVAVEQDADQFDPSDVRELTDLLVGTTASKVPGGDAIRDADGLLPLVARHLGVNAERLSSAASDFLEGRGEWSHLEQDAWWMRLYLRCHFCPGGDRGMALYRLAKRHHVPSYHNKAKHLGLSLPKDAGEALASFRNTHIGQWLLGCGVPVEADRLDEISLALKILCLAALKIQEPC